MASDITSRFQSICVFAGSYAGSRPEYAQAAAHLGRLLAGHGITVVYGGGKVGLMGVLADAALEAGGAVIGVIPRALLERELAHERLTTLHVVDSMHERKALMAELVDGFIALPGGAGTLEELFEVWTWAQLGFHKKPCGVVNVSGYYDLLARQIDHMVSEKLLKAEYRDKLFIARSPEQILDCFRSYVPPGDKWAPEGRFPKELT